MDAERISGEGNISGVHFGGESTVARLTVRTGSFGDVGFGAVYNFEGEDAAFRRAAGAELGLYKIEFRGPLLGSSVARTEDVTAIPASNCRAAKGTTNVRLNFLQELESERCLSRVCGGSLGGGEYASRDADSSSDRPARGRK